MDYSSSGIGAVTAEIDLQCGAATDSSFTMDIWVRWKV
jgi:hypothetical protein